MEQFGMKPEKVRKARVRGDNEALSRLGRAGGKATAEKRAKERSERETVDEVNAAEAEASAAEAAAERHDELLPEDDNNWP